MAKLYFEIEADYNKVIKLRTEIEKLQKTMQAFDAHTSADKIKELESQLKALRDEYSSLTEDAAKSAVSIEKTGASIGKALAAIGGAAALKSLGAEIIRVRGEFQEMETSIETLVGKKMSDKLIPQIKDLAKVSPLTMTDIVGAEKMMLGFNIEADKTIGFLKALSDVSMGSSQKFNSLTLAFSQMSATGKLMGQDLNQMINAGFNPLQQISLTTGKSIAKLKDEMSKGAISAEMVQKAFIDATSEGGKFYKMSENASKTINGQLSMMEDAWDSALNEMGQKSESFIMEGLQVTTSLIENYKAVGEALLFLVGTYGAYKAALLANIALEKIQAVQRLSSIKGISVMTTLTGILTKKTAALNLVTKASPWGMAAAGVFALAAGTYKLFTYQTDLEKATNKLNQEVAKEQGNIDELFGKLDATKKGTKEYESAKQEIINQYGEYLRGLKDEVASLKDVEAAYLAISAAAKLAAQERAIADANEKANSDYNARKESALNEIGGLFQGDKRASSSVLSAIQSDFAKLGDGNISEYTKAEIEKYGAISNEILKQISFIKAYRAERDKTYQGNRKAFDEWGILSMNETELNKRIESVKEIKKQAESTGNIKPLVTSSGKMIFNSLLEVDSYLSALEARSAKITEGRSTESASEGETYREAYKKAEKRWKDAVKAVKDAKNKSLAEYEKAVSEESAAEKEFKKLGGDTGKQTDKQVKDEEKKNKELLSLQRQNEQDRINLMEDGTEKRLAQIELDYQKELDAYEEAKKKFGETEEVKAMKTNADLAREKAIADLKKENLKEELQSLYEYLQEYGTIQQQKYAIAKAYDMKIAEERNANKKKLLQKEKESAIASADANSIAMGIDWGATFEGVGNVLQDIAKETLQKVEEYMKTDEFKNLSAKDKKAYVDLRDNLRKETGEGATSPFNFKQWDTIAKQVTEYQKSVQNLMYAQNEHTIAVENLKRAEEELAGATDDTAKQIAQTKVDMAQSQVDITANNQNKAQEDSDKAKDNLTNSTNAAALGIRNFTSALNEMSSGSLYGFANGVTKLIGNLLGDNSPLSKGIEGLGGKIGGIVGAILQILEALGDNPQQFIDNLLKDVADAISNLIADLPKIIVTILERVVDIVGGVLGGIGSWFGLDNVGESDKNLAKDIERLTASNDNLRNALDNLSEKLEESSIVDAPGVYEKQVAALKESMGNTQEMMIRSAKAYSNGFLGVGGNHSSAYYIDKGMTSQDWARISKIVGKTVDSASDFFNLTSEQMALVATEATDLYSKIEALADDGHKDAAQYMDEYIEYYKQLQELENQYREKLTNTSFDSIQSDFKSLLLDMESDAEDFAESFEEMMKNAIIEAFVLNNYKDKLQTFYENFAAAMESGGTIDKGEQDRLRKEWEEYANQAIAERDALWETMGWDKSSYSQEATSKGFETMSQDTGEELNGRFTALQVAGEEIRSHVSIINITTSELKAINTGIRDSISGIQDQIAGSYLELVAINENTGISAKYLKQMKDDLSEVKNKIKNL